MKRKYLFVAGTIAIIGAVVLITLMQVRSVRSGPQASTPMSTYGLDAECHNRSANNANSDTAKNHRSRA